MDRTFIALKFKQILKETAGRSASRSPTAAFPSLFAPSSGSACCLFVKPNAVHCHGEPRILNMPRHRLKDICTLADPGATAGS